MKKLLLIVVGLFLLAGIFNAITANDPESKSDAVQTAPATNNANPLPAAPSAEEKDEVTLEEYQKVKNGMTYEEVVKIIGFEGTEQSSAEVGGIKTVMYMWQTEDGSNMNAMFENNKLVSKAQFGLK